MSAILTIIYPANEGDRFDAGYYADRHLPLVREAWEALGLERAEAYFGVSGLGDTPAPYAALALLHFSSAAALQSALGSEIGAKVLADLANFTTIQPIAQISSAS